MRKKKKNSDIPFHKTPVGGCLKNLLLTSIVICICGFITLVISFPIERAYFRWQFSRQNSPLIQDAVASQCRNPDYQADGDFDSSTWRDYYHNTPTLRITCSMTINSQKWDCSCDSREDD